MANPVNPRDVDEPPPVGKRWSYVYAFVLGALGVTIALLFVLTRSYA
jgi:hypothetical protein